VTLSPDGERAATTLTDPATNNEDSYYDQRAFLGKFSENQGEQMERVSLTAFFPAYNDQHTIKGIVCTAAEEMHKLTDDFEVLVVDDGSRDKTGEILDRLAAELPFLRVIHHGRNLGYGAALISGFTNARKDLIFYTDGDGQYDVREMHNLFACLKPNIDLVNGYKVKRADAWYRIWIGEAYRGAMRLVFRLQIRDVDCDFRLFRRYVFETISLESTSGVICVEMAKKLERAGFRMAEVPVSHYPRLHGRSEFFRMRHLAYTLKGLIKVWWNLVVSHRLPLWMLTAAKKS
jgi:glycosyltransferase involved in cell wall biosynthesis